MAGITNKFFVYDEATKLRMEILDIMRFIDSVDDWLIKNDPYKLRASLVNF